MSPCEQMCLSQRTKILDDPIIMRASSIKFVLFIFGLMWINTSHAASPCYSEQTTPSFSFLVKGFSVNLPVFSVFVMPGEKLKIAAPTDVMLDVNSGKVEALSAGVWNWTAPSKPGFNIISMHQGDLHQRLHVFVMRPASEVKNGKLRGYRIGSYPKNPYRQLNKYLPPKGFVEVTKDDADKQLTPLFKVGQFLSKQPSAWPKYLVLKEALLLKLHRVSAVLNEEGIDGCGIHIMSGFRTPFYNARIGNGKNSRHIYGGAADIFIDSNPKDGVMDDLNKDGKINKKDADFLFKLVDGQSDEESWRRFIGGLGLYGSTPSHGPFVHIDERGYISRWRK